MLKIGIFDDQKEQLDYILQIFIQCFKKITNYF